MNNQIVSSENEELILVNENDEEVGFSTKSDCHDGQGVLHRAFSILLFNSKGEMLIQKRHPTKRLWGGFWSNSCCSHPRKGESMELATERRLQQELGLTVELDYLYKFQYRADFEDKGAENELCYVYVGITDELPSPNATEVSDWRFVSAEQLNRELTEMPELYTPWFKQEWDEIRNKYMDRIVSCSCEGRNP